jgi:hypothetical protein
MKWSVSKVSRDCRSCGKAFSEGEDIFSCVVLKDILDDNTAETERYDFCSGCWTKQERKSNPFWRSQFRENEEESKQLPDKDTIMQIFREKMTLGSAALTDEEKREQNIFRYLLALMLERKKRLILCQHEKKDGRTVFYKDIAAPDIFQIDIPDMMDSDIAYYQEKFKSILPLRQKKKKESEQEDNLQE